MDFISFQKWAELRAIVQNSKVPYIISIFQLVQLE